MELILKNGLNELSSEEMFISDGQGPAAAYTVGALSLLAGAAVSVLTPAKSSGVKIAVEGLVCAAALYYV